MKNRNKSPEVSREKQAPGWGRRMRAPAHLRFLLTALALLMISFVFRLFLE